MFVLVTTRNPRRLIKTSYFDTKADLFVTLVDTPGFDDPRDGVTDTDTLQKKPISCGEGENRSNAWNEGCEGTIIGAIRT